MIARTQPIVSCLAKRFHGLITLNARFARLLWTAVSLSAILASNAVASPDWWSIDSNSALEAGTRGESVEQHLSTDMDYTLWTYDPVSFDTDQGDHIDKVQAVVQIGRAHV